MSEWMEEIFDWFREATPLDGGHILWLTLPLGVIQYILSIFPFVTLLLIHVQTFGIINGLLISWVVGSMGSVVSFLFFRYLLKQRFEEKWAKKRKKYEKWQRRINDYGSWAVILLRTIPFVPNNVVSILASISPISNRAYVWASVIGTFSHMWLFTLIGSTVTIDKGDIIWSWSLYGIFCLILLICFGLDLKKKMDKSRQKT